MTATKEPAARLRRLHGEIFEHYRKCERDAALLSDTWAHTLKQKGALYSVEEMTEMLSPGNRVNSWIDDFNYRIDGTILDRKSPVLRRFLALGENPFGRPHGTVDFKGRRFSASYAHLVVYAAKIVEALDAQGKKRPRILEVGGGLGGLAGLLREYYGERLTYYAVDLPETLAIQEWYLRGSFPKAAWTYKPGAENVAPAAGGFNFINAYRLTSQDVEIDLAINIDSMQEMNREAAATYIRYFEKNLVAGGLFYFQNHYGHSAGSFSEPSEYPLDARWKIWSAEFVSQIECCSEAEQARWIFERVVKPEDVRARRLVLRALWNGFVSGRIAEDGLLVPALARIPGEAAGGVDARKLIAASLRRRGSAFSKAEIKMLERSEYLAKGPAYVDCYRSEPGRSEGLAQTVWRTQSGLLQQMASAKKGGIDSLRREAREWTTDTLLRQDYSRSEFWSAYAGGMLGALKMNDEAGRVLLKAAARSRNSHWLVRFAYLLVRFDQRDAALAALDRLDRTSNDDDFVSLKRAELEHAVGRKDRAALGLASQARRASDFARLSTLAKTSARIGDLTLAGVSCERLANEHPEAVGDTFLTCLAEAPALASRILELSGAIRRSKPAAAGLEEYEGFLLLAAGRLGEGAARVRESLRRAHDDYFKLGKIGRRCLSFGMRKEGALSLERSAALRPATYLHHDFIGSAYLSDGDWAAAGRHFSKALALRPYLRHVQAKRLYCALPAEIRDARVFGVPSSWGLIFQRKQDFYHDLGPTTK